MRWWPRSATPAATHDRTCDGPRYCTWRMLTRIGHDHAHRQVLDRDARRDENMAAGRSPGARTMPACRVRPALASDLRSRPWRPPTTIPLSGTRPAPRCTRHAPCRSCSTRPDPSEGAATRRRVIIRLPSRRTNHLLLRPDPLWTPPLVGNGNTRVRGAPSPLVASGGRQPRPAQGRAHRGEGCPPDRSVPGREARRSPAQLGSVFRTELGAYTCWSHVGSRHGDQHGR